MNEQLASLGLYHHYFHNSKLLCKNIVGHYCYRSLIIIMLCFMTVKLSINYKNNIKKNANEYRTY